MNDIAELVPADTLPADRDHHGQRYVAVGWKPYVNRDGQTIRLVTWRSRCMDCQEPFEFDCSETAAKFPSVRRCVRHRQVRRPSPAPSQAEPVAPLDPLPDESPAELRRRERGQMVRAIFAANPGLEKACNGWLGEEWLA